MASIADAIFNRVSKDVNRILGDTVTYRFNDGSEDITGILVTFDHNKKVTDGVNNIIGYRSEAGILKSDIPIRPEPYDQLITDNKTYRIGEVTQINKSKWYVDIAEV